MSYTFTKEDKYVKPTIRKPLMEMPLYNLNPVTPDVFDAIDEPDGYDVAFGKEWVMGLNPAQTLTVLKRVRSQYMAEINKIQKEIDRISILELPYTDPRVNTPWPRYYELRVKQEKKR